MNCTTCNKEVWFSPTGIKYEGHDHTELHFCELTKEQKAKESDKRKDASYDREAKFQQMHDENIAAYKALTEAINHLATIIKDKK
jgi:hypothetical protein